MFSGMMCFIDLSHNTLTCKLVKILALFFLFFLLKYLNKQSECFEYSDYSEKNRVYYLKSSVFERKNSTKEREKLDK